MAFILKSERFAIHYREKFMSGNTDVLMKTKIFLVKICIWILFSIITNVTVHVAVFIAIVAVVTVSVILVGI